MRFEPFATGTLPRIHFGEGRLSDLPFLLRSHGSRALLVLGRSSFRQSEQWQPLVDRLEAADVTWFETAIDGEPSPEVIDVAVARFRDERIEVVVGIGGGSVLDAAKAIAGLLPSGNSVLDYLEDVGRGLPYEGPALPFIAVPTTAGTGSEATRNAVLSQRGAGGYKKSFRHDALVARVALVDPDLLRGCPPHLIAAQGMDAFTQLLESYVSLRANPFADALAWSGLQAVKQGFFAAWQGGESDAACQGRAAMAYAALLSGITLAQVGLGSVHGLAQPLGSLFPVPHGVACGTTLAEATAVNIAALSERLPDSPALDKYAAVGRLLADRPALAAAEALEFLISELHAWTDRLALPRLGEYGVSEADLPAIVAGSRNNSMRSNPIELTDEEVAEVVRRRI